MADRYWVGGNDVWNGTDGLKWSATSGGAGGAVRPGTGDIARFDANSGAAAVTTGTAINVSGMNFTGFTGSLTITNATQISGLDGLIGAATATLTLSNTFTFSNTTGGGNWVPITTNGMAMTAGSNAEIRINGAGGEFQLGSDLNVGHLLFTNGTFSAGTYNITVGDVALGSGTKTVGMGSGSWTVGDGATGTKWNMDTNKTNLTLECETSTLIISNGSAACTISPDSSQNLSTVDFRGTGVITVNKGISTAFSAPGFIFNADCQVKFQSAVQYTVYKLRSLATSGHQAIITATSAGSAALFALSTISPIANYVTEYMSMKDVNVNSGGPWYCPNSTNVSGNTNVIFGFPDPGVMLIREQM